MSEDQRGVSFLDPNHRFAIRLKELLTYMTSGWRRRLMMAFLVLLSLAVIARIFADNWELLLEYDWQFRPEWLTSVLFFFLIDFFLGLYAWHLLVSRLAHFNNLRLNIKLVLQSNLARRLPGSVWYVASRAVLYQDEGISKTTTSLLSAFELAMYIVSGMVVTLMTLPVWLGRSGLDQELRQIWLLAFFLPVSLVLVHPRISKWIWSRLNHRQPTLPLRWRDTILWLLLFIGTWVLGGAVLFSIINVFQPMPISEYIAITGMWAAAGTISLIGFVTISFFSLREVSLVFLLSQLVPVPIALIIAVVVRLLLLSGELLASLLAFRL
jgi:hypothetical protein